MAKITKQSLSWGSTNHAILLSIDATQKAPRKLKSLRENVVFVVGLNEPRNSAQHKCYTEGSTKVESLRENVSVGDDEILV